MTWISAVWGSPMEALVKRDEVTFSSPLKAKVTAVQQEKALEKASSQGTSKMTELQNGASLEGRVETVRVPARFKKIRELYDENRSSSFFQMYGSRVGIWWDPKNDLDIYVDEDIKRGKEVIFNVEKRGFWGDVSVENHLFSFGKNSYEIEKVLRNSKKEDWIRIR